MQKIIPFFWYDNKAEEAVKFYISVFREGKILNISKYDAASSKAAGMPEGSIMSIDFELFGQQFGALNGGPMFKFTEATSFLVNCETQKEIDEYWEKLTEGGEEMPCGWLKDKYGLAWQIAPRALDEMLRDKDLQKAKRVMEAMLKMKKIDLEVLKKAYSG